MAEEKYTEEPASQKQVDLRSSILEAIRTNIEHLDSIASNLARDATDLYGKNTAGDGYAKNTAVAEEVLSRSLGLGLGAGERPTDSP